MKKRFFTYSTLFLLSLNVQAQLNKPKDRVKVVGSNTANQKMDEKIQEGFNEGFNSIENGVKGLFKKKKKSEGAENAGQESNEQGAQAEVEMEGKGMPENAPTVRNDAPKTLKSYSKFDFVSGEKVLLYEDFTPDAIGDFPARWNTNATAEVVQLEGREGKWLKIGTVNGSFIPEAIKSIPENATIEFDLIYNNWKSVYAYARRLDVSLSNPEKQAANMGYFSAGQGATFTFDGGMGTGSVRMCQTREDGSCTDLTGEKNMEAVINEAAIGKTFHIAIWRQKTRLRVYVDEQKVFDMPRIFAADQKLTELRFFGSIANEGEEMFLSNLKVAVGAPDTRNKLLTEGKFVTNGIQFAVGSANLNPSSYGVLKEIAAVLSENPTLKIKIIGHTDNDGDAVKNLELSKKRSEAVRTALKDEFGIATDRMQTDGKGATVPVQPNTSAEGKASNRRVEFLKL